MFKALRRTFMPINRWYDDLDKEHGGLRFLLFFVFVAIPFGLFSAFWQSHPFIGLPALIVACVLGFIRITAFL